MPAASSYPSATAGTARRRHAPAGAHAPPRPPPASLDLTESRPPPPRYEDAAAAAAAAVAVAEDGPYGKPLLLTHVCEACGADMVDGARFCHACGRPSAAVPEEQRYEYSVYDPGQHNPPTQRLGFLGILASTGHSPTVVPKRITSTNILSGGKVDLTRSRFIYPETTVVATQLLGSFKLVVPRGVNVRVNGMSILGNFKNAPGAETAASDGAARPTVTVVGASVLGGARVVVDRRCPPIRVVGRAAPAAGGVGAAAAAAPHVRYGSL